MKVLRRSTPQAGRPWRNSFAVRYLIPQVSAILDVFDNGFLTHWVINTDRAKQEFDLSQPNRQVIRAGADRVILIDLKENRYQHPRRIRDEQIKTSIA